MSPALESTDAKNKLEDLSGVKFQPGENPYKSLIEACDDDPVCDGTCNVVASRRPDSCSEWEWESALGVGE